MFNPNALLVPAVVTALIALIAAFLKFKEYRRTKDFGVFGVIAIIARLGVAVVYLIYDPTPGEITYRAVLIRFFLTFMLLAEVTRSGLRSARQS